MNGILCCGILLSSCLSNQDTCIYKYTTPTLGGYVYQVERNFLPQTNPQGGGGGYTATGTYNNNNNNNKKKLPVS